MKKLAIWSDETKSKTTKSENFTVAFRWSFNGTTYGEAFAKDVENAIKRFGIETSLVKTALQYTRLTPEEYYASERHQDNLRCEKKARETFEVVELTEC